MGHARTKRQRISKAYEEVRVWNQNGEGKWFDDNVTGIGRSNRALNSSQEYPEHEATEQHAMQFQNQKIWVAAKGKGVAVLTPKKCNIQKNRPNFLSSSPDVPMVRAYGANKW